MVLSDSPIYNTIFFYILIFIIILVLKPDFMYCQKSKKFKSFGLGKDQTVLCLPIISIISVITLYLIFLVVQILGDYD